MSSRPQVPDQRLLPCRRLPLLAGSCGVGSTYTIVPSAVYTQALADKASEEATRLSNAAVAAAQPTSGASPACRQPASLSPEELTRYGVTEDLLSLVSGLSYSMFRCAHPVHSCQRYCDCNATTASQHKLVSLRFARGLHHTSCGDRQ